MAPRLSRRTERFSCTPIYDSGSTDAERLPSARQRIVYAGLDARRSLHGRIVLSLNEFLTGQLIHACDTGTSGGGFTPSRVEKLF